MARTGLIQDNRFQRHATGPGHPERPERLAAIAEALSERRLDEACTAINASPVDMALVRSLHTPAYLDRLESACRTGLAYIDEPDSAICTESLEIARLGAGAVIGAVDAVMAGTIDNAFCAVRPPGHHAEHDRSRGFCLLGNVALAAKHLIDHHRLDRILILDWDVHHGNGTQHLFDADPRVLFISLHGHPDFVYPGSGFTAERGIGAGEGFTLNIPMLPGTGDAEYHAAFADKVQPEIQRYAPQFVLISAGFDAHRLDPLAPINLESESFGWMTRTMTEIATRHCDGHLVSVLEGGYHLPALAESVSIHIETLLSA